MLAAQFGHCFPGQVVQILGAFIIDRNRQDHAVLHSIQILHKAEAFAFEFVGVKSEETQTDM